MLNFTFYQCLAVIVLLSSVKASLVSRIIGGNNAEKRAYPYQASLRVLGRHKCGGCILNERWILTAAHCLVKHKATTITVVLGSNSLKEGGVAYRVALGYPHPGYNETQHTNDIGLLSIVGIIKFTDDIQPIPLPDYDISEDNLVTGIFTGWGNIYLNGANNDQLQVIVLHVIQLVICQNTFPNVQLGHLCTFNGRGEGLCYGDSGSPLVSDGVLIGVASWGSPCAQGYPDVHTRVYHYLDWIDSIIIA